jgi:K+-sensing histidine kinase KdpD
MVADIRRRGSKAEVDGACIEQILQNLLHNAERHTRPGGIIVVVVEEKQGKISIQIKDTGEGIAEEELSSIWERAYPRSGGEEEQERETVGLGVALVKEWTEAMGGRISVESIQGEGNCFCVERSG